MTRSKTIRVTPNVQKCLEILKEAANSLPAGDLKEKADGAIKYLLRTFEGKPQPRKGKWCPDDLPIIR